MAKAFKNLIKDISPERLTRIEERVEQMLLEMALQEIRQHRQMTQTEMADSLTVNQSAVSKMEGQQDMHVSTLRKVVAAMGGTLKLVAEFPDEEIVINQFDDARPMAT